MNKQQTKRWANVSHLYIKEKRILVHIFVVILKKVYQTRESKVLWRGFLSIFLCGLRKFEHLEFNNSTKQRKNVEMRTKLPDTWNFLLSAIQFPDLPKQNFANNVYTCEKIRRADVTKSLKKTRIYEDEFFQFFKAFIEY